MYFNGSVYYFGIIDIAKDELGRYARLEVKLVDGISEIRCELDSITYRYLKAAVSKKYFDSLATGYRYELILYYQQNDNGDAGTPYKGLIRCLQGDRSIKVEFPCSERFAGNLEWFGKEVKTTKDIEHIKWS